MTARAEAMEATRARILEAAIERFSSQLYDEVSLKDVATDADVTVKTLLRHFGSKEGLLQAAIEVGVAQVERDRGEAPVGDVPGAIANLMEHYGEWGDRSLLFLAQEDRCEPMRRLTDAGKALHHAWVDRVFAPWLAKRRGGARIRLRARLVAATDVYVWKIIHRDLGLDPKATEATVRELVEAVLN